MITCRKKEADPPESVPGSETKKKTQKKLTRPIPEKQERR